MKTKTTKEKFLIFAVLVISLSVLAGVLCACEPSVSIPTLDNDAISRLAEVYDADSQSAYINFRNLINGDKSEESVGIADGESYVVGDELPNAINNSAFGSYSNSKINHQFLGWTDDATGNSAPFIQLPSGISGEVTLYAVWGVPDSYVNANITTSITSDKDKIEYDGEDGITLTAKVTHTGSGSGYLINPKTTYNFTQDTDEKTTTESVKTTGILKVTDVKDSGTYSFNYRLTDGLEPLWYYEGTCSTSKNIEIDKARLQNLSIKDFKISDSTAPYYGRILGEVEFSVKLVNKAGMEVKLLENDEIEYMVPYKWTLAIDKVSKGTNSDKKITIYPADTDNYEESYDFLVEFEAQDLVIVFDMPQISMQLEVPVEYGQNYGSAEIIYLFDKEYLNCLNTWNAATLRVVEGKAPYLDGMAIAQDNSGIPIFNRQFIDIKEPATIEVTFQDAEYEVTFNPNNGGLTSPTKENYKYGQFLKKPTPDPVNGDKLFVGWYFTDNTGEERAWRFNSVGDIPQDRVTGPITLTARWVSADRLLDLNAQVNPTVKFTAQSQIREGDLIVTAIFGSYDDEQLEAPVELAWGAYTITYTSSPSDGLLHVVTGGFNIQVSYTFGYDTKTADINLTVSPIEVDTSHLTFNDKTVVYDGTVVEIDLISGILPSVIIQVNYFIYTENAILVDPSQVYEIGTYTVRAEFEMVSLDYYAMPLTATLRIVNDSNQNGDGGDLDDILNNVKDLPLWQLITIVLSIVLIIVFISLTVEYDKRRRKFIEKSKRLDQLYAGAGAFLGLAFSAWTALAFIFILLAIASLVIMLVVRSKCIKAEEEYDKKREMYDRMNVDGIDVPDDGVYGKEEVLKRSKRKKK